MMMHLGMFLLGVAYALAAIAFVEAIHSDALLRHRWHRLPNLARVVLTIAWPISAFYFFSVRGHG